MTLRKNDIVTIIDGPYKGEAGIIDYVEPGCVRVFIFETGFHICEASKLKLTRLPAGCKIHENHAIDGKLKMNKQGEIIFNNRHFKGIPRRKVESKALKVLSIAAKENAKAINRIAKALEDVPIIHIG